MCSETSTIKNPKDKQDKSRKRTLTLLRTQKTGRIVKEFKIDDFISLVKENVDNYMNDHNLF